MDKQTHNMHRKEVAIKTLQEHSIFYEVKNNGNHIKVDEWEFRDEVEKKFERIQKEPTKQGE